MDGHDPGEDEEQNCLQVVRCSKGHVPSLGHWTLQAFRSLTCQSNLLRSSSFQGNRILSPAAPVVPLLHRSFSRGLLSSGYTRWKPNSVKCIAKPHLDVKMQDDDGSLNGRLEAPLQADVIQGESDSHLNTEFVGLDAQNLSSRVSSVDHARDNDDFVSSDGPCISCECSLRNACCQSSTPAGRLSLDANHPTAFWEDREERKEKRRSELDEMKERFAKLLLGEDMSGGAKGVCTALAISNAITNLSASIFGDLWRLEPLSLERKVRWKQEMEWLLSVSDHIVELVPSWQKFEDGSNIEVMIAKPRVDLHTNLPALRKLDSMLLAFLDSCQETEFWYVEEGVVVSDEDVQNMNAASSQRREENWWLPTPKVAAMGLSAGGRKSLQHQRKCMNQILKASTAINSQILSEMEIPDVYWNSLRKNGRTSLGETIYKHVSTEQFSPEAVLCKLDLSTEHHAVEMANRIEAAIHVWQYRKRTKQFRKLRSWGEQSARHSQNAMKESGLELEKRTLLAERAETLLLCLKQKFLGLRQSLLDMMKIQHNKDVGQSILESYSRVMESLSFNIIARIDDVLFADDMAKHVLTGFPLSVKTWVQPLHRRGFSLSLSVITPFAIPNDTPSLSQTTKSSQEIRRHEKVNCEKQEHVLDLGHLTKPELELNRA